VTFDAATLVNKGDCETANGFVFARIGETVASDFAFSLSLLLWSMFKRALMYVFTIPETEVSHPDAKHFFFVTAKKCVCVLRHRQFFLCVWMRVVYE
jgi:hypothetical protein